MVAQTNGIIVHLTEDINDILSLGDRTGHATLKKVATTNEGNTCRVTGNNRIAEASQSSITINGTVHIILIKHHNALLLLAHRIQIAKQGHLTTHGFTRGKLTIDPEIALIEIGFLTWPTIVPFRIAIFQDDLCVAAVMAWRPSLGTVEGCLTRMTLWCTIIAARGVAVGNMTLTQTGHLNNVTGITSQSPACLSKHNMFKFALTGCIGQIMGQHHKLQVLRHLPAAIVGTTA